ncbi:MAG: ABC transporter ATP-binding protein [Candidatus Symbiothrix sp.]|jgi:ABC-2 type transport system ATP-binding protein|nr:ABC transporter ATP-binding protein [Candidatus Symbiothrix sp.]
MIEIKNVSFRYGKHKPLFDDFSLNIEDGRIVGLLGKNGAGKSTLLRLIAGLLSPQKGELLVNAYKPGQRLPDYLASIYMIPEEFSLPPVSVDGYVKALSPLYPDFDQEKMSSILEEFELNRRDKFHKLSHGQRKKFLIAFAFASQCRLLILDEPTNGLDIPSKSLFRKVMVRSVGEQQLVLISTHQVKDIDTIIDSVVTLDKGQLVLQDNIENIGRKYLFETASDLTGDARIIYSEKSPSGYRIIRANEGNDETKIDLELFFNAIINKTIY